MKIFTSWTRVALVCFTILFTQKIYGQNYYPTSGDPSLTNNNFKILDVNGKGLLFFQSDINRSAEIKVDLSSGKGLGTGNTLVLGVNNSYGASYNQRILFKTAGIGRLVIENDGNVGIGTTNPQGGLEIFKGTSNNVALILNSSGPGWGSGMYFVNTAPSGKSYGIYSGGDGRFHFGNTATGVDNLVLDQNGNVGIGATLSTNPNNYKLAVKGRIGAQEVIVETTSTTWADYVFENTYNLRPLSQVESFIKENKHLPEIPSAKEVEANGINLGEMDALLLKKIEELTLYTIEINKKMEELKKENEVLKEKINAFNN